MELRRDHIAEFHHEDLTVFVRVRATELDKAVFEALQRQAVKDTQADRPVRLRRDLAQLFTCGWGGVTLGGSPVPYSWALLEAALPDAVIDALALFVGEHVDLLKTQS